MEIKVLESIIVRPAADTPRERLWLSDLDHLVQGSHMPTTHFYRRPLGSAPDFFDDKKLRDSLGEILVTFYPAAGRLARDEKNRFEIDCNGEGALFVVAKAEAAIDEFGDFAPSEKLMQLVPQVSQDIYSYPLFLVQVTHFKCGGVSLGIGIHHYVADGPSAMHMINSWADLTRGLGITVEPFTDRTLLRPRDPPAPSFPHVEYHSPPAAATMVMGSNHPSDAFQSSPPTAECLKISRDQLDRLRAKAPGYTKYEVIAAHLWRCKCKAKCAADHEDAKLYIQVDGRARLRPPLPAGFFGNPQFTATPIIKVGDLTGQPLEYAASVIHDGIARLNDEYIRSALDYLALQPDVLAIRRGPHLFKGPNMQVVSWMRMAAYEADFGWGPPVFMGCSKVAWEGQVFLLPSTEDGSLTFAISLQPEHMAIFKSVLYDI